MAKKSMRMGSTDRAARGKKNVLIVVAVVVVLIVAFIIYAVSIAEDPQKETLQNEALYVEVFSPDASQDSSSTDPNLVKSQRNEMTSNPVNKALEIFETRWNSALDTMRLVQSNKDLSYAFSAMEICHSDIMQDIGFVTDADLNSNIIVVSSLNPNIHSFSYNLNNGDILSGEVDSSTYSMYYIVKTSGSATKRSVEIVNGAQESYVKLVSSDGPYRGEVYFMLGEDGEISVVKNELVEVATYVPATSTAINPAIPAETPTTDESLNTQSPPPTMQSPEKGIYHSPSLSWEEIKATGNDFFSASVNQIANISEDISDENNIYLEDGQTNNQENNIDQAINGADGTDRNVDVNVDVIEEQYDE